MEKTGTKIEELTLEEIVELHNNQTDYFRIAMQMIYHGRSYQKKCIDYYMENLKGEQLDLAIKAFVDNEIELGKFEV